MPTVGGVFYERYQEGSRQGQVDPAFIKHFAFDTSGRTWRHGTERRVIGWLPVTTLAQQIVRAYLHFHPDMESDDVLDFMNLVFDDLPLTLQGSESDFSENSL